jgi:ubiquinone/menaquinone biosynthesis C-methylase UbiE
MNGMKLHIGCGQRHIPGFVHLDIACKRHVDIVARAECLPLRNQCCALIYASHILEHFSRNEYLYVLREWWRVLQPGGVLRLAVPDFAACARLYVANSLNRGLLDLIGLICGRQNDPYNYHNMVFDEPTLTDALRSVGFRNVRRWDWRQTEHAHVDDFSQSYLPHMDKDHGTLVSLNLEAIR